MPSLSSGTLPDRRLFDHRSEFNSRYPDSETFEKEANLLALVNSWKLGKGRITSEGTARYIQDIGREASGLKGQEAFLRPHVREMLEAIFERGNPLSPESSIRVLSGMAHLYYRKQYYIGRIIRDLSRKADEIPASMKIAALHHLARLNHHDPERYKIIGRSALRNPSELGGRSIALLAQAYAEMGLTDVLLFSKLSIEVQKKPDNFTVNDLAACVWSFALGADPNSFKRVWNALSPRIDSLEHTNRNAIRIYQAAIAREVKSELSQSFVDAVRHAIREKRETLVPMNAFEKDVEEHLKALKIVYCPQSMVCGYRVDFEANIHRKLWVIECNGAYFHRIGGREDADPRAADLFRENIIKKSGHSVLNIQSQAWADLPGPPERRQWLASKLSL